MREREVLFTLLSPETGECLYYCVINNVVVDSGKCKISDIYSVKGKDLRFSFSVQQNLFDRIEVAKQLKKESLIEKQINRFLQEEAVFSGNHKIFFESDCVGETRYVDFCVLLEKDLKATLEKTPLYIKPYSAYCLVEHAISALIGKSTSEVVLSLWLREGMLVALLVKAGNIVAKRVTTIKGTPLDAKDTIEGVVISLVSIYQTKYSDEPLDMLYLGELISEQQLDLEHLGVVKSEVLADSVQRLYKFKIEDTENDRVLKLPEIFGLPFVKNSHNLTPKSYHHEVRSYRLTKPVAIAASFLALVLCMLGIYQTLETNVLNEEIAVLESNIDDEMTRLERVRPSKKAIDEVARAAQLIKKESELLKVDRIIAWVSDIFGKDSILSSIRITPERLRSRNTIQNKPGVYRIDVEVYVYAQPTERDSVVSRVIWRLSEKMDVVESHFEYSDAAKEAKGVLSVTLLVKTKDFSSASTRS